MEQSIGSGSSAPSVSGGSSEVISDLHAGWEFVFRQGAMLAMMPIREWLEALDKAEALAPILDPTLYLDYLYSGKGEIIKDVLHHALLFKCAIERAQNALMATAYPPRANEEKSRR